MERSEQLRNVAFGGAWSEQIAGREAQAAAIAAMAAAAGSAAEQDPLSADTMNAVAMLCSRHPKGPDLEQAWRRAGRMAQSGLRVRELERLATLIAAAYGALKP